MKKEKPMKEWLAERPFRGHKVIVVRARSRKEAERILNDSDSESIEGEIFGGEVIDWEGKGRVLRQSDL
jgi:hypothetical protein